MLTDRTIRRPAELVELGLTPAGRLRELERVAARYAVGITPGLAELIDPADPADPIARQFVPDAAELEARPEELADPIGDEVHSPVPGIVHRYPDRVLLKPVSVCAVYCRFCFRRESVGPGKADALSPAELEVALNYIRENTGIWEVILSGGDPLVLSPRRLARITAALGDIPHVKVVRIHTRLPVADPGRITDALVRALACAGKPTWIVLHANHARELQPEARMACARLIDAGHPMLSQSVLLQGVNDDRDSLEALLRALVETRIKPYYLHHGDLAPGTSHLRTTLSDGQALMRSLRGDVSGLCQPTFMLDIPGGHGKSPAGPCYVRDGGSAPAVEDWRGDVHAYPAAR